MVSPTNNAPPTSLSDNSPASSHHRALTTSQSRLQSTRSAVATSLPAPKTRFSREHEFFRALRGEGIQHITSNPFVEGLMNDLQQHFDWQSQIDRSGNPIADNAELEQRKVECLKAGMYALRRIHTAWAKYPAVGRKLEGALITCTDFRFTAQSAVMEKPAGEIAARYARIMATNVDPPMDDDESVPHAQLRINDCILAIKKQYLALYSQMSAADMFVYDEEDATLSADEAEPKTYTVQSSSAILHAPNTAAQMMSSRGLMDAAEYEDDDNQHVFITGGVLKSKAEKRTDLTAQVTKAKKSKADEAAKAKAQTATIKDIAQSAKKVDKGKGKARKIDTPSEDSGSDEKMDEATESPANNSAEKTAKKLLSSKVRAGKVVARVTASEVDGKSRDDAFEPVQQPKANARKRSAPATVTKKAASQPAPKKRSKSTPANDTASKSASKEVPKTTAASETSASDKSSDPAGSNNTSDDPSSHGSVAPVIAKRGGAAPKWLKDEDDLVKQMIVDHPDWQMPRVYREYSSRIANTAYRKKGMPTHQYRADWVEFPQGVISNDKERRKYDIAWRTYESVRQHTEKFKAYVSSPNTSPPYTWMPAQVNQAAGLPKRTPPPRPTFFNNDARTPVPPATAANSSSALPAATSSVAPAATTPATNTSGWNAVNLPAPSTYSLVEQSDEDEDSAPGDDLVDELEDFIAQQSGSSSSAGTEQDVDEEMGDGQDDDKDIEDEKMEDD